MSTEVGHCSGAERIEVRLDGSTEMNSKELICLLFRDQQRKSKKAHKDNPEDGKSVFFGGEANKSKTLPTFRQTRERLERNQLLMIFFIGWISKFTVCLWKYDNYLSKLERLEDGVVVFLYLFSGSRPLWFWQMNTNNVYRLTYFPQSNQQWI